MEIEQIRQALERELGEGKRFAGYGTEWQTVETWVRVSPGLMGCTNVNITFREPTELAAIGRALQSAAGETMIPLREAVRVVEEACMSERRRCEGDYYGDMYGGAAIDGVEENAIAALQALGGGYV